MFVLLAHVQSFHTGWQAGIQDKNDLVPLDSRLRGNDDALTGC
jgi:hypothetical protein